MLGEKVEITGLGNFYFEMYGKVISEYKKAVLVEISLFDEVHKVMFYKFQVEIIK